MIRIHLKQSDWKLQKSIEHTVEVCVGKVLMADFMTTDDTKVLAVEFPTDESQERFIRWIRSKGFFPK